MINKMVIFLALFSSASMAASFDGFIKNHPEISKNKNPVLYKKLKDSAIFMAMMDDEDSSPGKSLRAKKKISQDGGDYYVVNAIGEMIKSCQYKASDIDESQCKVLRTIKVN